MPSVSPGVLGYDDVRLPAADAFRLSGSTMEAWAIEESGKLSLKMGLDFFSEEPVVEAMVSKLFFKVGEKLGSGFGAERVRERRRCFEGERRVRRHRNKIRKCRKILENYGLLSEGIFCRWEGKAGVWEEVGEGEKVRLVKERVRWMGYHICEKDIYIGWIR